MNLEQKYAKSISGLLYLTECTLATVDDLCMKKSASLSELKRNVNIAQRGIDVLYECGYLAERYGGRIKEVIEEYDRSVFLYAQRLREEWVPEKPLK